MKFVETTTKDNLILQGILAESETKDRVILHIHGMSGNMFENSFIKQMLSDYPKNGISFLTVELRGSEIMRWFYRPDNSIVRIGNAYEIFEESFYDIDAWVQFLKDLGYKEIIIQGHSLGPSKIVNYLTNKENHGIQSAILISPADMMKIRLGDNNEHDQYIKWARELKSQGKENDLIPELCWGWAVLSAKTYLNFFEDGSNLAIFNYNNPELGFDKIANVDIPILAITGTNDYVIGNHEESMKLLKENVRKCPKFEYIVFDGAKHDFEGFEKEIVNNVLTFIR